jgi:quercetin dioxygenase-like cupin family protein
MRKSLLLAVLLVLVSLSALAQDPVKVDSKHYKVEQENNQVRVLRIHYGAGEKSVMHEHPASVAVFLTDGDSKFTLPDGKTIESHFQAGQVQWEAAGKHLPENTGDKPFDLVLVELKGHKAAAKPASAQ